MFPNPHPVFDFKYFRDITPPEPTYRKVVLLNAITVDSPTGDMITKNVLVHVYTVSSVISRKQSYGFKFRFGDEEEHRNYRLIGPWGKSPSTGTLDEWVLLRTDLGEMLSMKSLGSLKSCLSRSTNHESKNSIGQGLMQVTRSVAPKRNESLQVTKTFKRLVKNRVERSQIRVSRVGGANGHAGGRRMSELRQEVCSPIVCGAIPRRWVSTIVIPVSNEDGVVRGLIPFYMGLKKDTAPVSINPMWAIPRYGWAVEEGRRLQEVLSVPQCNTQRQYQRVVNAQTYSCASILLQIGKLHPDLLTCHQASVSTWKRYNILKNAFDTKRALSILPVEPSEVTSSSVSENKSVCVDTKEETLMLRYRRIVMEIASTPGGCFLDCLLGKLSFLY